MMHRSRLCVVLVAIASVLALALTATTARGDAVVIAALVIAVAWAAAVSVFDAVATWGAPARRAPAITVPGESASVAFVMSLGDERPDIARTSLLLAAEAGPVHVVATRHHEVIDELGSVTVTEHIAPTMQAAVREAASATNADALLLLSASAFPVDGTCRLAAARLTDDVGWVTGTAPTFNTDRYAPRHRELLSMRVRSAARRLGLVTWEPDATLVRTDLLREHPLDPAKPFGHWLRARRDEGYRGLLTREPFAIQAAPADAPVFWPARTIRQRGVVADLADVMTSGPTRGRLVAAGALMRELFAYPLLLWLVAIVLIGRSGEFPLRTPPVLFFTAQLALGGARWAASRMAYGIGLHPVEEARATAYDLPGSLLALPSALTRRVRRARFTLPDQPLLWAAVALTFLSTAPLIDRRAETNSTIGVAVGLTLMTLVASWIFAMRAFGARGWDRVSYRLILDRPANVNGAPARVVDASPSGLGLTGVADPLEPGARVEVEIEFDDASIATLRGTVSDCRASGADHSLGIALDLNADARAEWVRSLFSAAGLTGRVPTLSEARSPRRPLAYEHTTGRFRRSVAVMVPGALLVALSLVVTCALVLVFLGYRPMVERSGSMVPTLKVGDIVVNEWVHADQLRPGDIVTFPQDFERTELVTHRVERRTNVGRTLRFVTRGDANIDVERWTVDREKLVGRVAWRIPVVGSVLIRLGSPETRRFLLTLVVAGLLLYGFVAVRPLIRRPAV
jgi:signal peptidase I